MQYLRSTTLDLHPVYNLTIFLFLIPKNPKNLGLFFLSLSPPVSTFNYSFSYYFFLLITNIPHILWILFKSISLLYPHNNLFLYFHFLSHFLHINFSLHLIVNIFCNLYRVIYPCKGLQRQTKTTIRKLFNIFLQYNSFYIYICT